MVPILSLGEQFPTSIGVMRGSLTAQRCHHAKATHSTHLLLPTFLFFHPIFYFCVGVIIVMIQNQIYSTKRDSAFVAPANRASITIGAIQCVLQKSVVAVILRDCAPVVFGAYFRLFL
ncbi:hypothetical protein XH80_03650 [Bradyrhizobium sp. CCBAU 45384]|nr:hypothetical protein [Bradyrhizobium sp. CCBAU 45384]